MLKVKSKITLIDQCKMLPGELQQICLSTLNKRYKRHYHPRNAHHKKHLYADIVMGSLVLLLIVFSLYILIYYRQAVLKEKIDFVLSPQIETVYSGGELPFEIEIKNNSGQSLYEANLEFPDGLTYVVSMIDGQPFKGGSFLLGTLDKGEKKKIPVIGYVLAATDKPVTINAILRFQPNPFLGFTEKLVSVRLDVSGSSLSVNFDFPETLVANQPFSFSLDYENSSPVTNFEQVSLLPNWPPSWEVINSEPSLEETQNFWMIDSIGSLEKGRIVGQARLLTADLEKVEVGLQVFAAPFGTPLLQQKIDFQLPVRYPNVTAEIKGKSVVVNLGQELTYIIKVKNQEDFNLRDVALRLVLNQAVFSLESLTSNLDQEGKLETMLINSFPSRSEQEFKQTFKIRPIINPQQAFGSGLVQIKTGAELFYRGENEQLVTLPLKSVVTEINSDLSVQAFARYFSAEGDQIGRGPIPPLVGETTKYWIFIHLNNQLHPVERVNVEANLPLGVDWTGRSSVTAGNSLNFDPISRNISWSIDSIPDYQHNFDQADYGSAFEVAVTPKAEQEGEPLILAEQIRVEGLDTVSQRWLSDSVALVDNALKHDAYATDGGRVGI